MKNDSAPVRRIARQTLEQINKLPEQDARRVVYFLALLYLRPAECRKIIRLLTGKEEL